MTPAENTALKFLLTHLVYGLAGGTAFGVAVLAINLSNIRTLIFESAHPVLVTILMFFGLLVTFGSVSMGVGIMTIPREDQE